MLQIYFYFIYIYIDSFGKNSLTLLMACVNPADSNKNETLKTLRFANDALKIKTKTFIKDDIPIKVISYINYFVEKLLFTVCLNVTLIG